jgi:hypothetical protein
MQSESAPHAEPVGSSTVSAEDDENTQRSVGRRMLRRRTKHERPRSCATPTRLTRIIDTVAHHHLVLLATEAHIFPLVNTLVKCRKARERIIPREREVRNERRANICSPTPAAAAPTFPRRRLATRAPAHDLVLELDAARAGTPAGTPRPAPAPLASAEGNRTAPPQAARPGVDIDITGRRLGLDLGLALRCWLVVEEIRDCRYLCWLGRRLAYRSRSRLRLDSFSRCERRRWRGEGRRLRPRRGRRARPARVYVLHGDGYHWFCTRHWSTRKPKWSGQSGARARLARAWSRVGRRFGSVRTRLRVTRRGMQLQRRRC